MSNSQAALAGIKAHEQFGTVMQLQHKIDKALKKDSRLIDPIGIYCQHTGRRVGRIDLDTLNIIIHSVPPQMLEEEEFESLWDELETRALLSARPSPAWMHQSLESYKALCLLDPVGAIVKYTGFAFIKNWEHRKKRNTGGNFGFMEHQWISVEDRVAWQRNLCQLFLSATTSNGFTKFNYLDTLYVLIHADAKIGLHNIEPPKVTFPVVDSWDEITGYYKDQTEKFLKNQARTSRAAKDGSGFSWSLSESIRINHRPSKTAQIKLIKEEKSKEFDSLWAESNIQPSTKPVTVETTPEELRAAMPEVKKIPVANRHTVFKF